MNHGRIFQISASNGGIPERPLRHTEINELGLTSDKQIHTKVHGGPERAVCLSSLERIWARAYTRVLQTGTCQIDDPVTLEPPDGQFTD